MSNKPASARRSPLRFIVVAGFKVLFAAFALAIPLLGVWVASSLAAHHDQSMAVSLTIGALCFPIGPVLWELFGAWRRARKTDPGPRILTFFDRMLLRTLVINIGFVSVLVAAFPSSMFEALSTRGDWMLDGRHSPTAERARTTLFSVAERMRWLHELTHPNAYRDLIDDDLTSAPDDVRPAPVPPRPDVDTPDVETPDVDSPDGDPSKPSSDTPAPVDDTPRWGMPAVLHPLVTQIPASAETSYESVAKYIADHEPDELRRLKALHDYVADRISYDVPALRNLAASRQDAKSVFEARTGVCAGYAALLARMGDAAGMEIVVVVGNVREDDGSVSKLGHAWNAARVDGGWVLLDPTWNAGYVNGDTFTKKFGTSYFMSPPEVFGQNHFPDDVKWQLREDPLSLGEFVRQPLMDPSFSALGLTLNSPARPTITAQVGQTIEVELDNPRQLDIELGLRRDGSDLGRCEPNDAFTRFSCTIEESYDQSIAVFGIKENIRKEGLRTSWTRARVGRIHVDVR